MESTGVESPSGPGFGTSKDYRQEECVGCRLGGRVGELRWEVVRVLSLEVGSEETGVGQGPTVPRVTSGPGRPITWNSWCHQGSLTCSLVLVFAWGSTNLTEGPGRDNGDVDGSRDVGERVGGHGRTRRNLYSRSEVSVPETDDGDGPLGGGCRDGSPEEVVGGRGSETSFR